MEQFVKVFKALSDKTRLRIVCLLNQPGLELCVGEIVDVLGENQYNVSRHLKALKESGLVQDKKRGRWVHHSLIRTDHPFYRTLYHLLTTIDDPILRRNQQDLVLRLSLRIDNQCVCGTDSTQWRQLTTSQQRRS